LSAVRPMLEVCRIYTRTHERLDDATPLADSGVNDQLVKLRPALID